MASDSESLNIFFPWVIFSFQWLISSLPLILCWNITSSISSLLFKRRQTHHINNTQFVCLSITVKRNAPQLREPLGSRKLTTISSCFVYLSLLVLIKKGHQSLAKYHTRCYLFWMWTEGTVVKGKFTSFTCVVKAICSHVWKRCFIIAISEASQGGGMWWWPPNMNTLVFQEVRN